MNDRDQDGNLTQAAVDTLSDDQVLTLAGPCGPTLIGKALAERAAEVRKNRVIGTGVEGLIVGPAIADPDYHEKQLAAKARAARQGEQDPQAKANKQAVRQHEDPWHHVSLSGLKALSKEHKLPVETGEGSRARMVAALEAKKVAPPPVPEDDE